MRLLAIQQSTAVAIVIGERSRNLKQTCVPLHGTLRIQIREVAEWVHIDISDTGKGLTPKQFKTIFEPGYSTKKRGWGLGLTLVKRIVEEYHKGKVFVLQSTPDKGTTFRISIPH